MSMPESTGDAQVDAALARLAELDAVPLHEHADVLSDAHRRLQERLSQERA